MAVWEWSLPENVDRTAPTCTEKVFWPASGVVASRLVPIAATSAARRGFMNDDLAVTMDCVASVSE